MAISASSFTTQLILLSATLFLAMRSRTCQLICWQLALAIQLCYLAPKRNPNPNPKERLLEPSQSHSPRGWEFRQTHCLPTPLRLSTFQTNPSCWKRLHLIAAVPEQHQPRSSSRISSKCTSCHIDALYKSELMLFLLLPKEGFEGKAEKQTWNFFQHKRTSVSEVNFGVVCGNRGSSKATFQKMRASSLEYATFTLFLMRTCSPRGGEQVPYWINSLLGYWDL